MDNGSNSFTLAPNNIGGLMPSSVSGQVIIPASWDSNRCMYSVYGNFCSFSCALGWLRDRCFPDVNYQKTLLFHMARNIFNYNENFGPSPPQIQLKIFGGELTSTQFRLACKKLNVNETGIVRTLIREPPFIPYNMILEEHIQQPKPKRMFHNKSKVPATASQETMNILMEQEQEHEQEQDLLNSTSSSSSTNKGSYILASGKVPEGGLFQQFLMKQQSATTIVEQEFIKQQQQQQQQQQNTNHKITKKQQPRVAQKVKQQPQQHQQQQQITFASIETLFSSPPSVSQEKFPKKRKRTS
jgi:hypothetical protein